MPLDGQYLWAILQLEPLDHSVVGGSRHQHAKTGTTHGLMMQAVGGEIRAVERGQAAPDGGANDMTALCSHGGPQRVRVLLLEMLHQPAAEGDVEQLRAAADTQHRQVSVERGANELELPRVAIRFDLTEFRMRLFAV